MLFLGTIVEVIDNSGAVSAKIITGNKVWRIGTQPSVSIQSCKAQKKLKLGDVFKSLVVQTRKGFRRSDCSFIEFRSNSVVLYRRGELFGTRIRGVVPIDLRFFGFVKILLVSHGGF